jgi:carbonyl reductase 1
VRQLALQYPDSQFNNGPLLVYLTARDQGRGEAALQNLQDDSELKETKALKEYGGLTEVKYHHLDIADIKSIRALAAFLKQTHPGGIDFGWNLFITPKFMADHSI